MRSLFFLGAVLIVSQFTVSQTINDLVYLTKNDLSGTARYTSMGGAFGALGGDLTAIINNPASSSVFLNTEMGASINLQSRLNEGQFFGEFKSTNEDSFHFDQFGVVFVFNNTDEKNPWSRISAAINVNRIANFNQKASLTGNNNKSIADYFLYYANGIEYQDIQLYSDETISDVYRYLGDEIGFGAQQAFLGYQSYIIDPLTADDTEKSYISNITSSNNRNNLDILNSGFHRKTSFNFSGLYKNILHLGVNFNLHKLDFRNKKDFFEGNQDLSSFVYDVNFNEDLISFGDGFSFQFGGILKIENIRLGATYDSPQWIDLQDETQQKISSYRFEDGFAIKETINPDITNSYLPYRLKIPSKTTLSFAYIFNLAGLISLDYSTQNFSQTYVSQEGTSGFLNSLNEETNKILNPVNTLKIGGEYRLKNVSLRGGYFYQTKNQSTNENGNQALTFGIGFDFGGSNLNLSLVKFEQNRDFTVFSRGLTSPYSIKENLTQFTLSYNFKL